ncbi:histidine kinase dimerization/phospho-acceptor domain-containing protein, partial [Mesorhizobium sp.]|uniref:histidine kinase dimerization/phospho-acceptor domain-containing protein n=1 Tax=Mesorhizobium sp. TaxID=1871066 RepID=UPI00344C7454
PPHHGRRSSGRLPVTGAGDEFDRLSENLNSMLARIATLNEGLKQVSDNIAHDLKTPLTRLRNRAEATLSGKHNTSDYRQALEGTIAESD